LVYRSLARHLKRIISDANPLATDLVYPLFGPQDYAIASDTDRRDLLQKLIDAGREHEYARANDLQNRFAQEYYRLGLHTEAKAQSDAILSQVEQRFTTHVFNDKICKDATDEQIKDALQNHVIEPICLKKAGQPQIASAAVLQALYFLTERCHIQWDKP